MKSYIISVIFALMLCIPGYSQWDDGDGGDDGGWGDSGDDWGGGSDDGWDDGGGWDDGWGDDGWDGSVTGNGNTSDGVTDPWGDDDWDGSVTGNGSTNENSEDQWDGSVTGNGSPWDGSGWVDDEYYFDSDWNYNSDWKDFEYGNEYYSENYNETYWSDPYYWTYSNWHYDYYPWSPYGIYDYSYVVVNHSYWYPTNWPYKWYYNDSRLYTWCDWNSCVNWQYDPRVYCRYHSCVVRTKPVVVVSSPAYGGCMANSAANLAFKLTLICFFFVLILRVNRKIRLTK